MTVWWILFFVAVGVVAALALFGAFRLVRVLINSRVTGSPAWCTRDRLGRAPHAGSPGGCATLRDVEILE